MQELAQLNQNGIELFGVIYPFRLRDYILDAPARSKVKCIVGHTGVYACENCEVEGFKVNNVTVYLDMNATLRTDESFRDRINENQHTVFSPLEPLGTGMVSQFRKDGLHLLHEGVFKRWSDFVLGNKAKKRKGLVTAARKLEVSDRIMALARHIPQEFNRRPRPLIYRLKFHASEYRRLFLYDGLLVFQILPDNIYRNYLILQAACYILSSPDFYETMNDIAEDLLHQFIIHSSQLFGRQFVFLYVHYLIHFAEECRVLQCL